MDQEHEKKKAYLLKPGETVFLSSVENIRLPNDCMAIVNQRNSSIRQGLFVSAPVYHPGHHTKIFIRVTNISQDGCRLTAGGSIASIMFYALSRDVERPYAGTFSDEFNYRGIGDFHPVAIPDIVEMQEQVESIKDVEKNLHSNVITLMTIFIGIFSLINLNINFLDETMPLKSLLVYNLIFLGGISTLVMLTSLFVPKASNSSKKTILLGVISLGLIAAAFVVFQIF